jgi:hypothetical protein
MAARQTGLFQIDEAHLDISTEQVPILLFGFARVDSRPLFRGLVLKQKYILDLCRILYQKELANA